MLQLLLAAAPRFYCTPAVGVLPLQTDDSYDAVGMQIPPAQMTDGRLGDQ